MLARSHLTFVVAAVLATQLAGCTQQDLQWGTAVTGIAALHAAGLDGDGVDIAILDTGIDPGHPSLRHLFDESPRNGEVVAYRDFVDGGTRPGDASGHGTFVTGILAARPGRGTGGPAASLHGLAPGASYIVARVCQDGQCSPAAVQAALAWSLERGADIVSLSFGFDNLDLARNGIAERAILAELAHLEQRGVLVVAAAGNSGSVFFPARVPTVLAVGAMDRDGSVRTYSSRGYGSLKPDLVAPGEDVVGPSVHGGVVAWAGTSAAVPFVTATAALLMQAEGKPRTAQDAQELRDHLRETAAPLPDQERPHDRRSGHGLVQADAAQARYRLALLQEDEGSWAPPRHKAP